MTRNLLRIFGWLLLALPVVVFAANYDATRYITLDKAVATQTGDKIEVAEFFWYGCPHCYRFEPHLEKWVSELPDHVEFIRIPAPLNPRWMPHTKTYYALEIMGEGEKYHHDLFKALHEERKRLFTLEQIADFLADKGVDRDLFMDTVNSFGVEMRARKAAQLGQEYALTGVPMLAVNGKYVISTEKAGSYREMLNIADFLIAKESR